MNQILTVRKSSIKLVHDLTLDTYTADEVDKQTGMFINYFSGSGMALAVDLPDNTALQSRLSKKLKAMLGENFTVLQSKYRMESGGLTDLLLWTISDALTFWEYWAFVSNSVNKKAKEKARNIIITSARANLQIVTDEAFGRGYTPGKAQELMLAYQAENQRLKKDLDLAKEALAEPDVLDDENWRLRQQIREMGGVPYDEQIGYTSDKPNEPF